MSEVASTKELKRVLGRKELLSIGIGQTIGSGIFAMVVFHSSHRETERRKQFPKQTQSLMHTII